MNILNITNELGIDDGVSSHVINLSRGLKKFNCECYILTGKIRSEVKVDLPVIESDLFHHNKRSVTNMIKAIRYLNDFIKLHKIDVINSHSHYAANIAKYTSHLSKVKTVQSNHGLLSNPGLLKEFNADKIIHTNEHTLAKLNGKNSVLIKHGLEIIPFNKDKFKRPFKIFSSSRFVTEKNIEFYIRLANKFLSDNPEFNDVEFILAGDGEQKEYLLELNKSLGGHVVYIGIVPDFISILNSSSIYIYPSKSENEGFPVSLLQAGMCSNLILTSDFIGLSENFENKKDGIVIDTDDIQGNVNLLNNIINNFNSYISLAETYHQRVCRDYSFDEMIEKHYKLFSSLL